jgi:hypothetical protein
VRFRCEDPSCDFSTSDGLPLKVVDDEIYEQPPTLLLGTVDKFAIMPWDPEARKIFGIDNPGSGSPPDLIIQDELHLISGPLGSMVGHYETVVDEFCTNRKGGHRIPPKIIASTATMSVHTRPGGHPRVSKFGLGQDRADGGLVARAREAEPPLHQ